MTAARFLQLLGLLEWTVTGASQFFGVTDRTGRRWIMEDRVPLPIAMVLELMIELKLSPEKVLATAGVRQGLADLILSNLHDNRL